MPLHPFIRNFVAGSVFAAVLLALIPSTASAIPVYARQTGEKCVACHVGGMYPLLTSFGRM
ncbi:MAG: cytochrome C, partial [Betaproteobacteria bacterium]|nr:cytochrome C [Betaproteobacteria bacterium]